MRITEAELVEHAVSYFIIFYVLVVALNMLPRVFCGKTFKQYIRHRIIKTVKESETVIYVQKMDAFFAVLNSFGMVLTAGLASAVQLYLVSTVIVIVVLNGFSKELVITDRRIYVTKLLCARSGFTKLDHELRWT